MSLPLVLLLFGGLMVSSCTSNQPRPDHAGSASLVAEDLLRIPLREGRVGYERLVVGFANSEVQQEHLTRPDLPAQVRHAGRHLRLADGSVVESVQVGSGAGANVRIGKQPCFSVGRAARAGGIELAPPYLSLIEDGKLVRSFTARGDGVTVTFTTLAPDYRCVFSVSIYVV
ncbi:hypothetical protein J5226_08015 [Lysobacter sp. K5869]|uniref:hypothetical protein n=1 Tax=Lysobacter sp. K5869 TaxID=2820808 RepID=UPI001C063A6D|nr:hypothetical protein [Lysobacter sp. K5869]QWP78325.1 hypothetical protein J5226_08015 [Lysobacter sp. K5869]